MFVSRRRQPMCWYLKIFEDLSIFIFQFLHFPKFFEGEVHTSLWNHTRLLPAISRLQVNAEKLKLQVAASLRAAQWGLRFLHSPLRVRQADGITLSYDSYADVEKSCSIRVGRLSVDVQHIQVFGVWWYKWFSCNSMPTCGDILDDKTWTE